MKFRERKMATDETLPFVKLQDGESLIGLFAGDPYEFYQHWEGERSVICPGKDTCSRCKDGKKGSFRFRLNLIVRDGQALTAKVFEQGATVYDTLRAINAESSLEKTPVKILRKGMGKHTTYLVFPQTPLNAGQLGTYAKVPLRDLSPQAATTAPAEEAIEESADVPF